MSQSVIKAKVVGLTQVSESEHLLIGCIQIEGPAVYSSPQTFLVTLTFAKELVLPPLKGPFQFFGSDFSVEIVKDSFRKLVGYDDYYEGMATQVFKRKELLREIA